MLVDVGDDGSAGSFQRSAIAVSSRAGNDIVRIDKATVLTDSIPTTIDGGTAARRQGHRNAAGGEHSIDVTAATTRRGWVSNDTFVTGSRRRQRYSEGQAGTGTMLFNSANAAEQVDVSAGNRLKLPRQHRWTRLEAGHSTPSRRRRVTVNDLTGTDVGSVNLDLAGTLNAMATPGPTTSSSTARTARRDRRQR
jgi:hypothetical protein